MLLCHGMGWAACFGADTWVPVLAGLGERFQVFAPDKLASGMTDNPLSAADYTIEAQVAHMYGFIARSAWSACTWSASPAAPTWRRGWHWSILSSRRPSCWWIARRSPPRSGRSRGRRSRRDGGCCSPAAADVRESFRFTQAKLSYSPDHITDEFVEIAAYMEALPKARETLRCWQEGGEARFEASLDRQKEETLRWLAEGWPQVPTLVVWGRNDPSAVLAQGVALFELLCERNAATRMWIVNQAGHFPYREHPAEWARSSPISSRPGKSQRLEGTWRAILWRSVSWRSCVAWPSGARRRGPSGAGAAPSSGAVARHHRRHGREQLPTRVVVGQANPLDSAGPAQPYREFPVRVLVRGGGMPARLGPEVR